MRNKVTFAVILILLRGYPYIAQPLLLHRSCHDRNTSKRAVNLTLAFLSSLVLHLLPGSRPACYSACYRPPIASYIHATVFFCFFFRFSYLLAISIVCMQVKDANFFYQVLGRTVPCPAWGALLLAWLDLTSIEFMQPRRYIHNPFSTLGGIADYYGRILELYQTPTHFSKL